MRFASLIASLTIIIFAVTGCSQEPTSYSVTAPDGGLSFKLTTDELGRVYFAVDDGDTAVISSSRMGFAFANAPSFTEGLSIAAGGTATIDTTWELPWGERRFVRDHHNEQSFVLSDGDRTITLRVRMFDDGAGFRFEFPADFHAGELLITDELTQFNIANPSDKTFWNPAYNKDRYEYEYVKTNVTDVKAAHTPLTILDSTDRYVTLHEASLIDYSSMVLRGTDSSVLNGELVAGFDGVRVRQTGAFVTPWRTIQVTDSAPELLASNMILNLNEPNKLGDVSWVKPGVYMGIWWGMHLGENSWATGEKLGATTSEAKRYIDFISENGLDGFLVEGWNIGWDGNWIANADLFSFTEAQPFFDLEEVAAYAQEKNVDLVLHNETSGGIKNYEDQMEEAYALYQSLGVSHLKTGYVGFSNGYPRHDIHNEDHGDYLVFEWNHGQFMVNHYQKSIDLAAKYKIGINMHEPIKPTGLRRTYPNFMTREGVRGQEYNAWSEGNQPAHTTILPFTRMMGGPLDFTPGVFDVTFKGPDASERIRTTITKQLALMVVLYSPLQMAADLPRNYAAKPELFQFIKDVPADWEESLPLEGEIGEYVVYARQARDSENWFIGGITNEDARSVSLDFSFLGEGDFTATVYRDGEQADWETNPYDAVIESMSVNASSTLDVAMAKGGGFAISVIKQ
ncbi:MAG: glycoside hydrolase family 97 protein [Pseudomonadales bacterium]